MQTNDMKSNDGLIQRYVGTAYDKIVAIYNHLDDLLELLQFYRDNTGVVDAEFVFEQTTPEEVWHIEHNLDKPVSVSFIQDIEGTIEYVDNDHITITFSEPVAGSVSLN